MKKTWLALAVALGACMAAPALAAPSVGVSIGIHQPGVYGRIDIGSYPQPALVYAEPVVIAPPPVAIRRQPIYLYVPAAHQQDWRRYCGRYSACGQPVYFVQDRWVRERWEHEHHRQWRDVRGAPRHGDRHDRGRHEGHDKHDKHDKGGHRGH